MKSFTVKLSQVLAHPRQSLLPADYLPLDFPMPGDKLGERRVIASVEYFDDERGAVALVLLLNNATPYFTVAHYARTEVKGFGVVETERGAVDVIGTFENIVPAVREYEQNGGDY